MTAPERHGWFRRHRKALWRSLWAVVLVCHAPLTINAFSAVLRLEEGRSSGSSLLLLAASNAFFVLEILFACSLQLLSSRRNLMVFLLVVVLLHTGVFESGLPGAMTESQLLYCLLLTALGAADWRRLIILTVRLVSRIQCVVTSSLFWGSRRDYEYVGDPPMRPDPGCSYLSAPLRAPPISAC
ncbi:MAG: hypothetical protein AABZ08_12605 [Planctomycetota bacterium]